MIIIEIFGKASGKLIKKISYEEKVGIERQSLMDFLISHGIPIASSCSGEGICRKCIVNVDIQNAPGQNIKQIFIDYL